MLKVYLVSVLLTSWLWTVLPAAAQLVCSPNRLSIFNAGGGQAVSITDASGGAVEFKYAGALSSSGTVSTADDFLVVIPWRGVTPATVYVSINPNVAASNPPMLTHDGFFETAQFTTVGQGTPSTATVLVNFFIPAGPPPDIQSVVNAASLKPVLSPGAIVSIFGTNLSGVTQSTAFDDTGSYPRSVAGTLITFNGVEATLLYVSPSQVNAIVPFSMAGQTSVLVVAFNFAGTSGLPGLPGSPPVGGFPLTLQDVAPAIFTATQTGSGQAAVQQQSLTAAPSYNSSSNPAHAGDAITIFATGQGIWTPPAQADVLVFSESFSTQPVSVMIGGQQAKILYSGSMGGTLPSASVLQVNAVVPSGLAPGPQPLVLTIGANNNSAQNVVVYVQ